MNPALSSRSRVVLAGWLSGLPRSDTGALVGLSRHAAMRLVRRELRESAVRYCEHCSAPLSRNARSTARTCSARCRKAASRGRHAQTHTDSAGVADTGRIAANGRTL